MKILTKASPPEAHESDVTKQVPWSPWVGVTFIIVLFFASQLLAGVLISIYPAARHWSSSMTDDWLNNSVVAQFVYVLLAEGLVITAIYRWLGHYKVDFASLGLVKPRWRDPGYALLAAPVYYIAYIFLLGAVSTGTHININQQQQIGFTNVHGLAPLILAFISLVVLPPLAEEIMMRGFMYGSLRKAMPAVTATLVTSAVFAAAHLPEGGSAGPLWVAAVDTFVLSLVLCFLREKTGSLWASITLHALKNGVAFAALFIIGVH